MLTRFWTVNSVKYENVIIGAIKRNMSDLELQKWKAKVGKQGIHSFYLFEIRPDQFNFQEHRFFSKFEGSVGWKKKENKKNPQFFALALIINKSFL